MTRYASIALVVLLGGACRLGGPNGEATTLVVVDASLPEGGSEPVLDAGPAEIETDTTPPASGDDAAIDDAADGDAATGDAAPGDGAISDRPDTNCAAPPDLECDPVSGEGCLPFTQCVADPSSSSSSPAAYCVLSGIQLDVTCTQDEISTDCPPQHTCVMGVCRKYCYCDADCESGAPCGEGSTRFRLCEQPSPP